METKFIDYKIEDEILFLGFGKETKKSMTVLDESTLTELNDVLTEATRVQNDPKSSYFLFSKK